jgi:hypothetical protein
MDRRIVMQLLGAVFLLAGCQRTVTTDGGIGSGRPVVVVNGQSTEPDGAPRAPSSPSMSIDRALKSDPCSVRLHEISGAMLTCLAIQGRLPRTLDELQSMQGPGEAALNFTCPTTGEPYVYVPQGLRSPGDPRQIVVHDRSPDPTGLRWVILMQPAKARQAPATWVMRLPESEFRRYQPPAPTTHRAPTSN